MTRILPGIIALFAAAAGCATPSDRASETDDGLTQGPATTGATASAGPQTGPVTTGDSGVSSDTGAAACPLPIIDLSKLQDYQRGIVSDLSGANPLPSGETLSERATDGARIETRAYLTGKIAELDLSPETHIYSKGVNVFTRLQATTNSAVHLVIGAHYDTVGGSPGATDNASGVALVLALARILSDDAPCRDATVIFVLFDEGDNGFLGSEAFATYLDGQALDVESVHTVDLMGWDDDGDRAIEVQQPAPGLVDFYTAGVSALGLDLAVTPTQTSLADHVSFRRRGFAAVGLSEEVENGDTTRHRHRNSDTALTVNFDFLASSTQVVATAFALRLRKNLERP